MKLSREEFNRLALEQLDAVDRVARTFTRGGIDSGDLVQETYLNAMKAYAGFELQEFGIRPWLLRILHNVHLNRLKREGRQPRTVEIEQLEAEQPTVESAPLPWESLHIDDEQLQRALKSLAPELHATLVLWAVDELTYKEIAHVMAIPMGTVMSRLHRARHYLAELLKAHPAAKRQQRITARQNQENTAQPDSRAFDME